MASFYSDYWTDYYTRKKGILEGKETFDEMKKK
jgi:hypothetical protein